MIEIFKSKKSVNRGNCTCLLGTGPFTSLHCVRQRTATSHERKRKYAIKTRSQARYGRPKSEGIRENIAPR